MLDRYMLRVVIIGMKVSFWYDTMIIGSYTFNGGKEIKDPQVQYAWHKFTETVNISKIPSSLREAIRSFKKYPIRAGAHRHKNLKWVFLPENKGGHKVWMLYKGKFQS